MQARFMDAVVKVYCVHTEPNYSLPWQRKRQFATTSSGFIVDSGGERPYLLTNAHSVEYHSQVPPMICPCRCLAMHSVFAKWLSLPNYQLMAALCCVHDVHLHMQVKVKRRGDDQKFLANVLAIGTECDIALLTVEDAQFWEGVTPLEFGPLPRLQVSPATNWVVGHSHRAGSQAAQLGWELGCET